MFPLFLQKDITAITVFLLQAVTFRISPEVSVLMYWTTAMTEVGFSSLLISTSNEWVMAALFIIFSRERNCAYTVSVDNLYLSNVAY